MQRVAQRWTRQSGAIAIISAITLGALLMFVALAVDTGRLYLEKRSLQQRADLAALQAAQLYCSGFESIATVENGVKATLLDHGFDADDPDNTVTVGLGTLSSIANRRTFTGSASEFQAVQVVLTRTVPSALFGGSVFSTSTLSATGVAERDLIATLSAGNALLSVDSSQSDILDSVLGGLLGGSLSLSAASYQGLVEGAITFGDLIAELSAAGLLGAAASLNDLSNLDLSLSQLLTAINDTLTLNGGSAAALSAMTDIITEASSSGSGTETVDLGSLLVVDDDYAGSEQGKESTVTPLQLITASLLAVNLGDTINLNIIADTASLPMIQQLFGNSITQTVALTIQSVPTIAVGRFGYDTLGNPRTRAEAAAVDLVTGVNLNFGPGTSGLLDALLSNLLTVSGNVYVAATSADTEAWLDQINQCPRLLSRTFDFTVGASPGVASAILRGATAGSPADLSVDLNLLGLGLVTTTLNVAGTLPIDNGSDSTIPFTVDLSQADAIPTEEGTTSTSLSNAVSNGVTSAGNTLVTNINAQLLGLPITLSTGNRNILTNNLLLALSPILGGVTELTLDPVLEALGLAIGEVRVQILDVQEGRSELMM